MGLPCEREEKKWKRSASTLLKGSIPLPPSHELRHLRFTLGFNELMKLDIKLFEALKLASVEMVSSVGKVRKRVIIE